MRPVLRAALGCALCTATLACGPVKEDPGDSAPLPVSAAQPPAVLATTLFENERFWPYRVKLVEPWTPEGGEWELPARSPGVLIRLEDPGLALVDFAGLGIHGVPVARTDLVHEANEIAAGRTLKLGPNLVAMIAPRLFDSTGPVLAKVDYEAFARQQAFLCVFADPEGPAFATMVEALAPLGERDGLGTAFFPQGGAGDEEVRATLQAAGWTTPFMRQRFSHLYTETLLTGFDERPALLLLSPEGRLLYRARWEPEGRLDLERALSARLDDVGFAPQGVPEGSV